MLVCPTQLETSVGQKTFPLNYIFFFFKRNHNMSCVHCADKYEPTFATHVKILEMCFAPLDKDIKVFRCGQKGVL